MLHFKLSDSSTRQNCTKVTPAKFLTAIYVSGRITNYHHVIDNKTRSDPVFFKNRRNIVRNCKTRFRQKPIPGVTYAR